MNNLLKIKFKKIGIHIKNFYNLWTNNILLNYFNIKSLSFFLGNPLKWKKNISNNYINKINTFIKKFNINKNYIIPHCSYLINLGSPIDINLKKSISLLKKEIFICSKLGIKLINFHIGNHLGIINEYNCINNIINSINFIIDNTSDVILVMENSSGQGNSIGYNLDHISNILLSINNKSRIGVCIDIGHAFAAGYDLRNFINCEKFFVEFDNKIGLMFLKALHLNGSRYKFFSKKDKHSTLLNSFLGNNIFYWIMKNNLFDNIPIILETINPLLWINEINWLYSL